MAESKQEYQDRIKQQRKGAARTAMIIALIAIAVFAYTMYAMSGRSLG